MELRDLRYFCTVAKTQHISRAADILGVSQPFLTKIIHQLEDELGCELFDHVGRRIQLNDYGRTLLISAEKIINEVDDIHKTFEQMIDDPDQPLRLATGSSAYCSDLPLKYMEAYPDSSVSREYMDRKGLVKALEENEIDFAICSPAVAREESELVLSRVVHKERACLILPAEDPAAEKEYVTLKDLEGRALITTLKGSDTRNNIDAVCAATDIKPKIVYESIDNNLIMTMVSKGIGSTIFAWNYAKMLPESDKYVIREFSDCSGEICLCRNINLQYTRAHQRFEAFVVEYFKNLP